MLEALTVTIPVFLIIFTGWLTARLRVAKRNWVHVLSTYVYYVALPALILTGFWDLPLQDQALPPFVGIHVVSLLLVALVVAALLFFLSTPSGIRASIFMGAIMGNTVYMGFPVAGRAFGAGADSTIVLSATIYLLFGLVLALTYIELIEKRGKSLKMQAKSFAGNPLLIALAIGALFNVINFSGEVAEIMRSTLNMFGRTASPVALFALGVFFSGASMQKNIEWTGLASAMKLILFPALTASTLVAYQALANGGALSLQMSQITVTIAAMPAAVTTFVLAERFQLDKTVAANTVILSTVVSVVTLIILLSGFG